MKPAPAGAKEASGVVAGQLHDGSSGTGLGGAKTSSTARYPLPNDLRQAIEAINSASCALICANSGQMITSYAQPLPPA